MAKKRYLTEPDHAVTTFPSGIKYIIGNEGCERFSYYGMRAILYVYIVGLYLNLRQLDAFEAEREATATYHAFGAAVYALPMIGALIADRLVGKYGTILWLSIVYCVGHLALAIFEKPDFQLDLFGEVFIDPIAGLYIGLGLIAIGSGGIKPCVSAHVGDQFGRGNWHLLEKVYNAFYFIINFGSAFSTVLIPAVRGDEHALFGYVFYEGSVAWAFGIPGILMGVATFFFWMGRRDFIHVPARPAGKLGLLDVLSGSALFAGTLGIPLVVYMAEVDTTAPVVAVSMVACIALFALLFRWRQRIEEDDGFLAVVFHAVSGLSRRGDEAGRGFFAGARAKWGDETVDGTKAVLRIMSVFLMVAFFWALFDQHASTWIAQARDMDRTFDMTLSTWLVGGGILGLVAGLAVVLTVGHSRAIRWRGLWLFAALGAGVGALMYADVNAHIGWSPAVWLTLGGSIGVALAIYVFRRSPAWIIGLAVVGGAIVGLGFGGACSTSVTFFEVQPSQVPTVNPFLVMVLIPITTFGIYPLIEGLGAKPHPLFRMTLGMAIAGLSFVAVALIEGAIDGSDDPVHVLWQLIPYAIITLAEVMVSITGLEFGYSQAPKRLKSVIMGFWLLMIALGNVIVVFFAGLQDMPREEFFWVFAALMFGAAVIFGLRAKFYTYRDYTQ